MNFTSTSRILIAKSHCLPHYHYHRHHHHHHHHHVKPQHGGNMLVSHHHHHHHHYNQLTQAASYKQPCEAARGRWQEQGRLQGWLLECQVVISVIIVMMMMVMKLLTTCDKRQIWS